MCPSCHRLPVNVVRSCVYAALGRTINISYLRTISGPGAQKCFNEMTGQRLCSKNKMLYIQICNGVLHFRQHMHVCRCTISKINPLGSEIISQTMTIGANLSRHHVKRMPEKQTWENLFH
ncbi:hypothetical protein D1872_259040 [compost metagenome]